MTKKSSSLGEFSSLGCLSFFLPFSLLFKRATSIEEESDDELPIDDASSLFSGCDNSQSVYYDSTASKVQALPSFSLLVQQSQYAKILKILSKESIDTLRVWLYMHDSYTIFDATTEAMEYASLQMAALHTSLCVHCMFANFTFPLYKIPPPEFLQVLLDRLMDAYGNVPEDVMDSHGYTPLHIWIIQKLYLHSGSTAGAVTQLFASTSAPMMQDSVHRRCPLHWLCWNGPPQASLQDENISSTSRMETLLILLDAYPEATLMYDNDGRTPLDLALDYPWDIEFLLKIQKVTDDVLRNHQNHNRTCFTSTLMKVDRDEAVNSMAKSTDSSARYFLQNGIPYKVRLFTNGATENKRDKVKQSRTPVNAMNTNSLQKTRARERVQRWREFMDLDGDSTCVSCLESSTILSYQEVPPLTNNRSKTASSQKSVGTHSTTPASDSSGKRNNYIQMEC